MSKHDELLKPFKADEIEWRVQQCDISNGKPWVRVLAYVQARAIQHRLDEVFGWDGWTEEYRTIGDNIICRLGVLTDKGWIYKENGASNTDIEAFKGGISGAFKRVAASGYGIGRYLYSLEEEYAECSTEKQKGWEYCKTRDKKSIYWKVPTLPKWALPEGESNNPPKKEEQPKMDSGASEDKPQCSACRKEISVAEHDYSAKNYGKPLCRACQAKAKKPA